MSAAYVGLETILYNREGLCKARFSFIRIRKSSLCVGIVEINGYHPIMALASASVYVSRSLITYPGFFWHPMNEFD